MRRWLEVAAAFGCAVAMICSTSGNAAAQHRSPQIGQQPKQNFTLEGPAIVSLVTQPLLPRELRKLVTESRTAEAHPDLATYYRSEAQRLQAASQEYERFARAAGDNAPLNATEHFGISRSARFDYLAAKEKAEQARDQGLLAALYTQAERRQGCFACHSLNGRGGMIGPDLAKEGTRGRSKFWLIGHFKDPVAYTPNSAMPAVNNLTPRQLEALSVFLLDQKPK